MNSDREFRCNSKPSRNCSTSFKINGLGLDEQSGGLCGSELDFGVEVIIKSRADYPGKIFNIALS